MTPEADLERYFYRAVRARGGMAEKLAPTRKGIPDRMVLLPGGIIQLVELKVHHRVTPAQRVWHERAAALGTTVLVLRGRAGVDQWLASLR